MIIKKYSFVYQIPIFSLFRLHKWKVHSFHLTWFEYFTQVALFFLIVGRCNLFIEISDFKLGLIDFLIIHFHLPLPKESKPSFHNRLIHQSSFFQSSGSFYTYQNAHVKSHFIAPLIVLFLILNLSILQEVSFCFTIEAHFLEVAPSVNENHRRSYVYLLLI